MMDTQKNTHTITVPVGIGGKTNPYIPDPAPTLLIELPSVATEKEELRLATLSAEAESTAAELVQSARAEATSITEEAAHSAAEIIRHATESAADVNAAAEARQAELDARSAELDGRSAQLESWSTDLEGRESALSDREVAVDAEAAEAAAILASARESAEQITTEARHHAEEVLADATATAADVAARLEAEAREAAESVDDAAVAERIDEIESVHRIEVQVLHDREAELLERVAHLESRISALTAPPEEPASSESSDDRTSSEDERMEIDLESASLGVQPEARSNGRHTTELGDRGGSTSIASHAPLTEQLSTSAFRTVPDRDRKGRRRR